MSPARRQDRGQFLRYRSVDRDGVPTHREPRVERKRLGKEPERTALTELHRATQARTDAIEASGEGHDLRSAFLHSLVAYLALGNVLAMAEDSGALTERPLVSTHEEFDTRLRHVAQGSSVTG